MFKSLHRFASNLKIHIAVLLFLLVLVMMGLLVSLSITLTTQVIKKAAGEQQFLSLSRATEDIDHGLLARQAELEQLASGISEVYFHDKSWLQHYLQSHSSALSGRFTRLSICDIDGNIVASIPRAQLGPEFSARTKPLIWQALRAQKTLITAPPADVVEPSIVSFALPLFGIQAQNALVLIGHASFEFDGFLNRITGTKNTEGSYSYLADRAGTMIAKSPAASAWLDVEAESESSIGWRRALNGFEGTLEVEADSGFSELQSFRHLRSADWILGTVSSEKKILADIVEMERKIWSIAILLAAFSAIIVWQALRRRLTPLRQLRDRMHTMHDHPLRFVPLTIYPENEIGELSKFFDHLMRERLLAEKNYRSTESELRAAANSSLDAFFIFHPDRDDLGCIVDFRFWYLNENAERLVGKSYQQAQDRRLCDLIPAVRELGLFDRMVEVIDRRHPAQQEFAFDSAQGGIRWLHGQAVPIEDGLAVTVRDISRIKKDEFEIKNSRAFLQSLIDYLPVQIFAKSFREDTYDQLVVWNKAAEEIMGYRASEVLGRSNHQIFDTKVAAVLNQLDQQMLAKPEVVNLPEFPYQRPDGALRYLRSISVPLMGDDGHLNYILGIVEDITVSRQRELDLRLQQAELSAVTDASPLGIFRTDLTGAYTYVNRTYERLSGISVEAVRGDGWMQALHPDDYERVVAEWRNSVSDGRLYQDSYRFLNLDGSTIRVTAKAAPIMVDDCITGYAGSVDDITARFDTEQRLRMISEHLPVMIAYVDAEWRYRFCNGNYQRLFDTSGSNLIGRDVLAVVGKEAYAIAADKMTTALSGVGVSFERSQSEDGVVRYWRVDYVPDIAEEGKTPGVYVMMLDITELKLVESRLRAITRRDSLTGLANRPHFEERLAEAINRSQRSGQALGLMFLDIDRFKAINDTCGHCGGDEVLRQFSQRLSNAVRQTDLVARLAGDEFVIILEGLQHTNEAEEVARKIIACMETEFSLTDGMRRVTTSVGITLRRSEESDIEAMLRRADEALYIAKSVGRNTYRLMY